MLEEALAEIDCPVLGKVPNDALVKFSEKHLGLVPVGKNQIAKSDRRQLVAAMEQYLDLDRPASLRTGRLG